MEKSRSSLNLNLDLSQSRAAILLENPRQLCQDAQLPPIWRGLHPPSCGMVELLECGILSLSRGEQMNCGELLRRHR